jgi:lipopolysaccharide/colanic/teichoic acid biosynthesis glycosyltransferase
VAVGFPLAVAALPVILLLALMNSILDPGHAPFFTQSRVGSSRRRLRIVKLRSMRHPGHGQEPVIRPFARFLRKHYLDELPQMFQVLAGELSLVGIRVLPVEVHALLARAWSTRRYDAWSRVYSSAPLGLTGLHQVARGHGKEDTARFHRDLFYARSASLGLDLYLLWRTIRRAGR